MRRRNRGRTPRQYSSVLAARLPIGQGGGPIATGGWPTATAVREVAQVDAQLCVGCGQCVQVCPTGAISLDVEAKPRVNASLCQGCNACASQCPTAAIRMVPVQHTVAGT